MVKLYCCGAESESIGNIFTKVKACLSASLFYIFLKAGESVDPVYRQCVPARGGLVVLAPVICGHVVGKSYSVLATLVDMKLIVNPVFEELIGKLQ